MTIHLKSVTLNPQSYPTREHYPYNLSVLQQTPRLTFAAPVTLFVGENGTGKSTLLRALAKACGIHIWKPHENYRLVANAHEHALGEHLQVEWAAAPVPGSFFSADNARFFAHLLEEWACTDPGQLAYFGGQSLVTRSHGQSSMTLFRTRYRIPGLYFMDEPEAALSPRSQIELLQIIAETSANGPAQFIISTHSPLLLACPGAAIYSFDRCPIAPIAYEQTAHYQIYKGFLTDRNQWLKSVEGREGPIQTTGQ
jgi:predicted ATPase